VHSGAPVSDLAGVRGRTGECPSLVNGRGSLVQLNIKLMMTENRKMKFDLSFFSEISHLEVGQIAHSFMQDTEPK
jgi:hypothetical protein